MLRCYESPCGVMRSLLISMTLNTFRLRIPMRGYETQTKPKKKKELELRIPMRGYESRYLLQVSRRFPGYESPCGVMSNALAAFLIPSAMLRIPMRGYEFVIRPRLHKADRLRIPMRGYERTIVQGITLDAKLRIPMRGYESPSIHLI